jgi:PTS system mannose-specific IIA component
MSVGVVIVTHYRLGEEFLQALRLIVPDAPPFFAVSIDPHQSVEEMRGAIAEALRTAEKGEGVLVLTDMFGGTPSNISLSFLKEHRVEVVTGANLPMLIERTFAGRPTMNEGVYEREFVVRSELGLHARPAGRFVSTAARFRSEVMVARGEEWVSGRSVLSLLSLAAAQGTRLRVRAIGEDAALAVEALGQLLESTSDLVQA